MTPRPPAEVGIPSEAVDTPALILDLDAFGRNLHRMADVAAAAGIRLRPHAKSHRSVPIAHKQLALGAVGICCQKTAEAEIMVAGGVRDIFVSNQIVGDSKLRRLAALGREARITVAVDHADNVAALSAVATEFDVDIGVMVEVDLGDRRAGVAPEKPALNLARQVAAAPHLWFEGLQAYRSTAQHTADFAERRSMTEDAVEQVRSTRDLLQAHGLACRTISGAGTGTHAFEANSGVFTEIQPGSYIFMDGNYDLVMDAEGNPFSEFEHSLFVLSTVMSRGAADRALIDVGTKSLDLYSGMPVFPDRPEARYVKANDEHGNLTIAKGGLPLSIGTKVRLIPANCDPTVNLYDWYVGVRDGVVEAVWPVSARGASL